MGAEMSLSPQADPSSASEPAGSKAAVSDDKDNSQTDSTNLNDENSEIRQKRIERFGSQKSSEKDKND